MGPRCRRLYNTFQIPQIHIEQNKNKSNMELTGSNFKSMNFKVISQNDAWWRHQMKTFSALLALCVGNSSVTGEFPTQRPVARSFDVFFDLRLNKRLSKHWWGWWFETPSRSLWRHCNELGTLAAKLLSGEYHKTWVNKNSTLVSVMACCHQAASHHLN